MNIQIKAQDAKGAKPLTGKVSLVTGSTSGIGLGIARALAEAGSAVVLNGFGVASEITRTQDQLAADFGVKVGYSAADMTSPTAIAEMIASGIFSATNHPCSVRALRRSRSARMPMTSR